MIRLTLVCFTLVALSLSLPAWAADAKKPNIVFLYADDLGYGDLGCYGAKKVKTPNCDRLAEQGLRFTDAHCTSASCTPSRYALMTGQYPWRKKGTAILPGDAALIIDTNQPTLPGILKKAGYTSAAIGKWHLGLGPEGGPNWNAQVKPGPIELGFDYNYLLPATGDRVPCVYVENDRVVNLDPNDPIRVSFKGKIGDEPTGESNPEMLKLKPSHGHNQTIVNGISRIGHMSGGKAARWVDEDIADVITSKAVEFIGKNKDRPFFLYYATHDIHVPRTPHARFRGKSGCGVRGDVIEEFDWCVGQIVAALEKQGLEKNTLVIVSSDNGPVVDDGYADGAVAALGDHLPAGPLKGGKYQIWEGGTRVPFIAYWPGRIKPGTSDALVCQIDFMASFAALAGTELPENAGPDSFNVLPALLGESRTGRDHLAEHAGTVAVRKGTWKYIPGSDRAAAAARKFKPQLYDLSKDLGELNNVIEKHPEVAKELEGLLAKYREGGRTRP